jgi:SET domain-containing protein
MFKKKLPKNYNYKPIHEHLELKKSDIDGIGIFAKIIIPGQLILATTHVIHNNEVIRTPLGGFINHSEDNNCELIRLSSDKYYLKTIKPVLDNTELTINYFNEPLFKTILGND